LELNLDFNTRLQFNDPAHPLWTHGGEIRRRHNKFYGWQTDNILNWNKQFGEHSFDVTGLWNAEENGILMRLLLSYHQMRHWDIMKWLLVFNHQMIHTMNQIQGQL